MQNMVSTLLPIAILALIALVGTIITITIGYRQWKRQQDAARYESFVAEKQAAYKELWTKVEEIHIKVRIHDVSQQSFDKLLSEVNTFILKNSLYLDKEDWNLANQYVETVYRFTSLIRASNDERANSKMRATATLSPKEFERGRELHLTAQETERIRNIVIERFRRVIGGKLV